jgi:hypothetical protein
VRCGLQKSRRRDRFSDFGIGAGDKEGFFHLLDNPS